MNDVATAQAVDGDSLCIKPTAKIIQEGIINIYIWYVQQNNILSQFTNMQCRDIIRDVWRKQQ